MTVLTERLDATSHSLALAETAALPHDSIADELNSLRVEHAKLQQAIFEAAQVQRRLCLPREDTWRGFEIAGEIFPVRHLSGDFFKVMKSRSALALALGDIAGKGLTAGIWQTHVMGLLHRAAHRNANPGRVLAEVNRSLCRGEEHPPLTALFFARINARANEMTYCNAGLPAPLLLRANGTLERLEEGGPMLGAVAKGLYRAARVTLNPGDMFVGHSDGVTECRNSQDEEFDMQRLTDAARAVAGSCATKALFSLLGTVLDFADSCSPGDDMTLLVLRRQVVSKRQNRAAHTRDSTPFRGLGSASKAELFSRETNTRN
jgi:sigma-B regulation protein RsbU (phosphoserine phosphatase)